MLVKQIFKNPAYVIKPWTTGRYRRWIHETYTENFLISWFKSANDWLSLITLTTYPVEFWIAEPLEMHLIMNVSNGLERAN